MRQIQPGLESLGVGHNKSLQVPGLSFPSSYRDSTSLSIFAVPSNAIFWITSNLAFMSICFMYSLKLTDTTPRAPITTGTTMTFALSSPGMATSAMTTSLSFLSIETMSGLLALIFQSHWTMNYYYYCCCCCCCYVSQCKD